MRGALAHIKESTMPEPPGLVMMRIDPKTGLLASPNSSTARFEIFRKEYAPHQYTSRSVDSSSNSSGGDAAESEGQIF